jgi:hypothetical protein
MPNDIKHVGMAYQIRKKLHEKSPEQVEAGPVEDFSDLVTQIMEKRAAAGLVLESEAEPEATEVPEEEAPNDRKRFVASIVNKHL